MRRDGKIAASSATNTSQITVLRATPAHHADECGSARTSAIAGITHAAATITGTSNRRCICSTRSIQVIRRTAPCAHIASLESRP
jgi:hypothetical protein